MANSKTYNLTPKVEVKSFARYVHVSPQKLRLVADLVRGNTVEHALEQMRYSSKKAAGPITKALNSAIANAIHNYNLKKENLFVKTITIDGGPVYKTMTPRAQGRGFVLRKRTSHINIILQSRERVMRKKGNRSIFSLRPKSEIAETLDKPAVETNEGKVDAQKDKQVIAPKSQEKIKRNLVSLKRRLFNRRTGS